MKGFYKDKRTINNATKLLIVPILAASLMIMSACTSAAPTQSSEAEKGIPWRFVDQSDAHDFAVKQEKLQKVDQFWSDFKQKQAPLLHFFQSPNDDRSKNMDITSATSWISDDLHAVDEDIMWEIQPPHAKGDTAKLVITAELNQGLHPVAETMVQRAPKTPGWTYLTYRDPLPSDIVQQGLKTRGGASLSSFSASVTTNDANQIEIVVQSPEFKTTDDDNDRSVADGLVQLVAGEELTNKWVGNVTTKPGTPVQRDFESSARKLFEDIQAAKKHVLDGLPNSPLNVKKPPEHWGVLDNRAGNRDSQRLTMTTWYPAFANASTTPAFTSERLSKCGERFCYLKVKHAGDRAMPEKRQQIMDAFDAALRKQKLGCLVASGWGPPDTLYLDVTLADVQKSLPELKAFCKENNLPHSAWLQFYDGDWRFDSVRMFDDSPVCVEPQTAW